MRRLRRPEIERRLAICEAYQQDPTLRYVDLQARFHAGPSIVASALKGGADTWLRMLGRAPPGADGSSTPLPAKATSTGWEYLGVEIRSIASSGGTITYEARDEGETEPGVEGAKRLADVLGAYGKLGWELAGIEKVGRGGGAFDGAWEVVFKRPVVKKGASK
nr:hypothetical protein [Candidatus Sigynarchaeum springense]